MVIVGGYLTAKEAKDHVNAMLGTGERIARISARDSSNLDASSGGSFDVHALQAYPELHYELQASGARNDGGVQAHHPWHAYVVVSDSVWDFLPGKRFYLHPHYQHLHSGS